MSETPDAVPVVLVVEDDLVLRMRAVDVVEDAGFTPVEAVNADEAMTILESRRDISLLFTDIHMPGTMDGLKLAHAVHGRWPHIKIILVSGQAAVTDADKPRDSRFFGKPVTIEKMIAELQDMIGAGALKVIPEAPLPATGSHDENGALEAENESLRLLLEQADISAQALLEKAGIDAKEREAANKLQALILGELHHRIKNTLATVSAIAAQSLRTATSIQHGQQAIESRLVALGRAHDLLMQMSWENASLHETVRSATKPFDSQKSESFRLHGPEIRMNSAAVIALAMTFNELCTNTTKFGALSVAGGRVNITWTIDAALERLRLVWSEEGGPSVKAPSRRSFGSRLIGSLGQQLSGSVELAYEARGFQYKLDVPLSSVACPA
ncbi:MAG: signal transduction histidine kinase [Hyphomicrobiales bacterium]|jgi:two-component sensor histidine kinase/CheY-like chemotaxis protein|nr:signal transduction histidine kinase [Hyphomicrobiales bacterium]